MRKPKIFLRADGDSEIGFGHIMRLVSIAENVRDHFECYFITKSSTKSILDSISNVCKKVILLPDFEHLKEEEIILDILKEEKGILVLDGYNFSSNYKLYISKSGIKIISVVDNLFEDFNSDVLINHAGFKDKGIFKIKKTAKVFLGPRYCMLRKEFLTGAKLNSINGFKNNVFVCFGAADPNNHTLHLLKENQNNLQEKVLQIVIGSAYIYENKLIYFLKNSNLKYALHKNLDAVSMYNLMSKCWMGITSASTIAYEFLCTRGLLFLEQTAENQNNIYKYLIGEKIAFKIDKVVNYTKTEEEIAIENQKKIFDGNSGERISKIFQSLIDQTQK